MVIHQIFRLCRTAVTNDNWGETYYLVNEKQALLRDSLSKISSLQFH